MWLWMTTQPIAAILVGQDQYNKTQCEKGSDCTTCGSGAFEFLHSPLEGNSSVDDFGWTQEYLERAIS